MKKCLGVFVILVLLLVTVQTAFAESNTGPVVTSLTGDSQFLVTKLSVDKLPGTTHNTGGILIPVGFGNGEKQFDGDGVVISGLSYGSASACFPIKAVSQGWGGKVGKWDGGKWVLLATKVTSPAETDHSNACATITSDGTYALLSWVVDPSKLPANTANEPACDFSINAVYNITSGPSEHDDYFTTSLIGIVLDYPGITTGVPVSVSFLSANPTGSFVLTGTGSGTIIDGGGEGYEVLFNPGLPLTIYYSNLSYTYRIKIGSCYANFTVVAD